MSKNNNNPNNNLDQVNIFVSLAGYERNDGSYTKTTRVYIMDKRESITDLASKLDRDVIDSPETGKSVDLTGTAIANSQLRDWADDDNISLLIKQARQEADSTKEQEYASKLDKRSVSEWEGADYAFPSKDGYPIYSFRRPIARVKRFAPVS